MATARRSIETKHGMDMEARSVLSSTAMAPMALGIPHCSSTGISRKDLERASRPSPAGKRPAVSDEPVIPCPPANAVSLNRVFRGVQYDDEGSPIWATSFDFTLHVSLKVQEYVGRKPSQATSA
jgi:hypothetical protein